MEEYRLTDAFKIRRLIGTGEMVRLRLPPQLAALIPGSGDVGTRSGAVRITPEVLILLLAVFPLATFGALAAYAISKGYTVRRTGPDGETWVFEPQKL